MFKQRLLTTLILGPLVLALIYYANNLVFAGFMLLIAIACGFEWLQLIPLQNRLLQLLFILLLIAATLVIHWVYNLWLVVGLALWVLVCLALLLFPLSMRLWGNVLVVAALGLVLLPLFAQSLLNITNMEGGRSFLVYLLLLVWAADIGAYLSGKQWGKHKLIPRVSPGKTWEGLLGGALMTGLVAAGGYYYFYPQRSVTWFALAALIFIVTLVGDLFISMLKRRTGVKDTGHLLPGHGGVLDRLDSLIAAAPVFYCGMLGITFGMITWLLP